RRAWLPPVSLHHAIAPRNNLANGQPVAWHVVVVSVYHSQFNAGNCVTGHGLPRKALLVLPSKLWVYRRKRKRRGCFRQAVARIALATEFFFNLTNESWRRRGAADNNPAQAAQIIFGALRTIHQRRRHDWNETTG